ncbi:hypothetical protein SO3561_09474 [Streptomyces olivochromogenes]|uniref:Uncharacterized protein n=1 Tax=Streptomyces olivochromogenes TaxID=1963 RepID=A0A250VUL3_STROL|nr:hypothetical protein SO3561_09474 [Streptomyces olivochromogenes]
MRLAGAHATVRRIWTVELRSRADGPRLVCPHCTVLHTRPLQAASARSAALAHLACHASTDALPGYLRTCQCRARGCSWHPRHRGCAGPVLLALTRDRSGRTWRLADACAACAAATSHTAIVPATLLAPRRPGCAGRRPAPPGGPAERTRVREMLTYLAAALPPVHLPCRPPACPAVRTARRHPWLRPAARRPIARHATARPQRTVGGAGTRRLAAPHSGQAPAYRGTAAGCRSTLPATRQPSPRRTLGSASCPASARGKTTSGRAADRTCPGLAHLGRRRQHRHGGARPPVRTLTPPDRATPRPAEGNTHAGHLAAQPGNRRSLLAPAPTAPCSTAR